MIVGGFLLGFYFWVSWATTGRTYGDLVMGLRVVNWQGEKMHWAGAAMRAAFCVVFGDRAVLGAHQRRQPLGPGRGAPHLGDLRLGAPSTSGRAASRRTEHAG